MNKLLIEGIDVNGLRELIQEAVRDQLKQFVPASPQPGLEYLTRAEVAKLLKLSLPTLHDYTKRGVIPVHRIQGRVRYIRSEVEACLLSVQSVKNKRYEKH